MSPLMSRVGRSLRPRTQPLALPGQCLRRHCFRRWQLLQRRTALCDEVAPVRAAGLVRSRVLHYPLLRLTGGLSRSSALPSLSRSSQR
jgi:hypothetical protein